MILETVPIVPLAVGLATAGVAYFFARLYTVRRAFRHLPCPPHDMLWGHLKLFGTYMAKLPSDTYIHSALTQIKQDYALPDLFYLDLWPFGPRFVVCSGPDAAAVPTTVTPFPQAAAVARFFGTARVGANFIEATNGPLWKELHMMLAPGLTPASVRGYHGVIADEAKGLQDHIRAVAERGETVDLGEELSRLPFGVITRIFFGEKMDDEAIRANFRAAAALAGKMVNGNNPWSRWRISQGVRGNLAAVDKVLVKRIQSRYNVLQGEKVLPTRATAKNFLERMLVGQVQNGRGLDERLMEMVLENAKGFLVAGWGTTTDTLCYIFILLSVFPDALRKVREEHDRVFDKDSSTTFQMLLEKPNLINELKYTEAVIHETLRLFPIGIVVRDPPPDSKKTFEFKGKQYPCEDHLVVVCTNAMHYNPSIFPSPSEFQPERFLTGDDDAFPRNAFRPFERGLRSCMGRELAMEEMIMALLMLAREFDFTLLEHEPVKTPRMGYTSLDTKLGIHAFQRPGFSAGPCGAVRMDIKVAKRA